MRSAASLIFEIIKIIWFYNRPVGNKHHFQKSMINNLMLHCLGYPLCHLISL